MVVGNSSIQIIENFFKDKKIDINVNNYLEKYIIDSSGIINLPNNIIKRIIADSFGASKIYVKQISDELVKNNNLFLGRVQKNQLKKYIDYEFEDDFNMLMELIGDDSLNEIELKEIIRKIINNDDFRNGAIEDFLNNIKAAILKNKKERVEDYLIFLYSRLVNLNERRTLSLSQLFKENKIIIKKELKEDNYIKFQNICNNNDKNKAEKTITTFSKEYLKILDSSNNRNEKNSVIFFILDQNLFNKFQSKNEFYSYLFEVIKKAYSNIQNHKSLVIKVNNIIHDGINLKWELYSYITLFSEKFRHFEESRTYYRPEEICSDYLKFNYGVNLDQKELKELSLYYKNKSKLETLPEKNGIKLSNIKKEIDYFREIHTGFTFVDCYILLNKNNFPNSMEVDMIKNNNELLLIFFKNENDDHKIPCPTCGSLKISGNSYPEIGIKSWECKNPLCLERSKTNRGKRYSRKSLYMQMANYDFSKENTISKSLIKKWRKDVVEEWTYEDLCQMIVKYYSYVNDNITVINIENENIIKNIATIEKRKITFLDFSEFLDFNQFNKKCFDDFFKFGSFIQKITCDYKFDDKSSLHSLSKNTVGKLIKGDCLKILSQIKHNSVEHMVTSPPYYNAREYSQWNNLYAYLIDMFKINKEAFRTISPGGVFFYNIGDIFDNENIVVKSTMGNKRIPLGAYTIFLFQKAGYVLLDNIIWYKGEPQSNRHKNDGNYTPYYQRPANCYEHMFIFKKPGTELRINKNQSEIILDSNIKKFSPVFKIGKGGINHYGHTAPFPPLVPQLSLSLFTNQNDIVLDPFSGSGTSMIIATKEKRTGVGVELNQEYAELSIKKSKSENVILEVFDSKLNLVENNNLKMSSNQNLNKEKLTLQNFM